MRGAGHAEMHRLRRCVAIARVRTLARDSNSKMECLAKFIIFGKRHLDYLVAEFVEYYNTRRSHMERDHLPPVREDPDEVDTLKMDEIEVKSYVGGLVKSFERKAA